MKIRISLCILLFMLVFPGIMAQDYSKLDKIDMKTQADYKKNESLVLECANYILDSRIDDINDDPNRQSAMEFIQRWMDGTPDYMFNIDESIGPLLNANPSLLYVYLAAMSKYVLEHKQNADNDNEVKYNSFLIIINYCEDSGHRVRMDQELRNLIKAKDDNKLREYLHIPVTIV